MLMLCLFTKKSHFIYLNLHCNVHYTYARPSIPLNGGNIFKCATKFKVAQKLQDITDENSALKVYVLIFIYRLP